MSLASKDALAAEFHVRDYTPGAIENGATWATAFDTIEEALLAAKNTIGPDRILIAAAQPGAAWKPGGGFSLGAWGTWPGPGATPLRSSTFLVDFDGVVIRGGYPAAGGPRDLDANPTVLSGDLLGDDTGLDGLIDDASNDENVYNVWTIKGLSGGVPIVIDGFQVTRGNSAEHEGPALPDPGEAIDDGRGGGAIWLTGPIGAIPGFEDGTLSFPDTVVQNCTIQLNAGTYGGAILAGRRAFSASVAELPTLTLRTSTIRANQARQWGTLLVSNGALDAAGCLVVDNDNTGAVEQGAFGGGFYLAAVKPDGTSAVGAGRFVSCTIANNVANSAGAGIAYDLGADGSEVTVDSCIVCLNRGPGGASSTFDTQLFAFTSGGGRLPAVSPTHSAFPYEWDPVPAPDPVDPVFDVQDPYFLAATSATPVLERDYRVSPCSPIRDFGQPNSAELPADAFDADDDLNVGELLPDAFRTERIRYAGFNGNRVDMGAIEHDLEICPGDWDFDGDVDGADLTGLLNSWTIPPEPGCIGPACEGGPYCHQALPGIPDPCHCRDWSRDGRFGPGDLTVLLSAWGKCDSGMAMAMGFGGEPESLDAPLTPEVLASMFGYVSVVEFSAWLGSLDPATRAAALALLTGEDGSAEAGSAEGGDDQ
jgi:hypothetical protein